MFPKSDFSILNQQNKGKAFLYFDNAATTHMPDEVIEKSQEYIKTSYSNIHRSVYSWSQKSTELVEETRTLIAQTLQIEKSQNIIFSSGTTQAINLISQMIFPFIDKTHNIVISIQEHHSNFLPWWHLCQQTGAQLRICPIHPNGDLNLEALENLIDFKTFAVSMCHVSNTSGNINPLKYISHLAKKQNALFFIDGAQGFLHDIPNLSSIPCDAYIFSAHKVLGPTGLGISYLSPFFLKNFATKPPQWGGGMISYVSLHQNKIEAPLLEAPHVLEAGTLNIQGIITFKESLNYLRKYKKEDLFSYEKDLLSLLKRELQKIPQVRLLWTPTLQASLVSFTVEDICAFDIGTFLNQYNICVRTGQLCAGPMVQQAQTHDNSIIRISVAPYNTQEDILEFIERLKLTIQILGGYL